jgi:L-lactate utilization protein LutB
MGVNSMEYETLASDESVERTKQAAESRNIHIEYVSSKDDALRMVQNLIPAGAQVMTGGSETLQEIGFIDLLKSGNHTWNNLKDKIMAEKDEARQAELRIQSVLSEYFLGSVHAIAETGELVFASATGSQLPSYAYTCRNVIWVAGTQKIVPTLADAIQRVEEYVLPREDARMKREGYSGSVIGKLLIVKLEIDPNRNLKLILVPEKLGF